MKKSEHIIIKKIIESLYLETTSSFVSTKARNKNNLFQESSLVYGDTNLDSLETMLDYLNPQPGTIFYDLGCGGGMPIFYIALRFAFAKCVGIEFIKELYDFAINRQQQLENILAQLPNSEKIPLSSTAFINGDFTKINLSNADIIYTYSTCFEQTLMEELAKKLIREVKPRTKIITITKALPSTHFKLLKKDNCLMSLGTATIWFHEKI